MPANTQSPDIPAYEYTEVSPQDVAASLRTRKKNLEQERLREHANAIAADETPRREAIERIEKIDTGIKELDELLKSVAADRRN